MKTKPDNSDERIAELQRQISLAKDKIRYYDWLQEMKDNILICVKEEKR